MHTIVSWPKWWLLIPWLIANRNNIDHKPSLKVNFNYLGSLLLTWVNFSPAWISNHIFSKGRDEITYPFQNFNDCTVEVFEWINNFIPHFIIDCKRGQYAVSISMNNENRNSSWCLHKANKHIHLKNPHCHLGWKNMNIAIPMTRYNGISR